MSVTAKLGTKYRVFEEFGDYRDYVYTYLITEPLVANNTFYRAMIDWVLLNKSPIFFGVELPEERITYTGCYNISPTPERVGRYTNDAIFTLFTLHEIVHQQFSYIRNIRGVDVGIFDSQMSLLERISSNETEFWVYVRIPELRELTRSILPRIWYDCMVESHVDMSQLTVSIMERYRNAWLSDGSFDQVFAPKPEDQAVRQYMAQFRNGNKDFLYHRLEALQELPLLVETTFPAQNPYSYVAGVHQFRAESHDWNSTQAQRQYEWNILQHIQLMYMLVGREDYPKSFAEAIERVEETNSFYLLTES